MSELAPELAMAEVRAQQAEKAIEQLQFHLDFLKSRASKSCVALIVCVTSSVWLYLWSTGADWSWLLCIV